MSDSDSVLVRAVGNWQIKMSNSTCLGIIFEFSTSPTKNVRKTEHSEYEKHFQNARFLNLYRLSCINGNTKKNLFNRRINLIKHM